MYHGTIAAAAESILVERIRKGNGKRVHVSADVETAKRVGERRGAPVLLVASGKMALDGMSFYLSENGVWLAKFVPPK